MMMIIVAQEGDSDATERCAELRASGRRVMLILIEGEVRKVTQGPAVPGDDVRDIEVFFTACVVRGGEGQVPEVWSRDGRT